MSTPNTTSTILFRYGIPSGRNSSAEGWWKAQVFRPLGVDFDAKTLAALQAALQFGIDSACEVAWLNFMRDEYLDAKARSGSSHHHSLMIQFTRAVQEALQAHGITVWWDRTGGPNGTARLVWEDAALWAQSESNAHHCEIWYDPMEYAGPHDDLGAAYFREMYGFYPTGYGG